MLRIINIFFILLIMVYANSLDPGPSETPIGGIYHAGD